MLSTHHISLSYETETILQNIEFTLQKGSHIGLVGPNGSGKSTLLRVMAGLQKPDSGSIQANPSDLNIGYLAQGFTGENHQTIEQFLYSGQDYLQSDLDTQLNQISLEMVVEPENSHLQDQFDRLLIQISLSDSFISRLTGLLRAFNLQSFDLHQPFDNLSGGQKTRLALLRILLSEPDILLLDEPTNHLDIPMLEWLENWLTEFQGGALVVSHDRMFLDRVAKTILELDQRTHGVRLYPGNFSDYMQKKEEERERRLQEYTDQQDELSRLRASASHLRGIAKFKRGGKSDTNDKFARGFFGNRALGTVGRARHLEKRVEQILRYEKIDKPPLDWEMRLEFQEESNKKKIVLDITNLSAGYPGNTLLENINLTIRFGQHIVLVGANGSGKTTLIRTIVGIIPSIAGQIRLGNNIKPGTISQEHENLDQEKNPHEMISSRLNISETEIRSFLSKLLFKGDEVFLPVRKMSFGERARLSLACLVAEGCNFLILDEPVNHLDISARTRFEQALSGFKGTILSVVHDRYYLATLATEVWKIENKGIRRFERTDVYGTEGIFT